MRSWVTRVSGWLVVLAFAVAAPAKAQDISVRAYLDRNEVGVNQLFVLNVEISGTQEVESS
jgi:hypothetical protein